MQQKQFGKFFVIKLKIKDICSIIRYEKNNIFLKENLIKDSKEEYLKALIRGLFLGSGSINNPENKYHLEITFNNEENLDDSIYILKNLGIKSKK